MYDVLKVGLWFFSLRLVLLALKPDIPVNVKRNITFSF